MRDQVRVALDLGWVEQVLGGGRKAGVALGVPGTVRGGWCARRLRRRLLTGCGCTGSSVGAGRASSCQSEGAGGLIAPAEARSRLAQRRVGSPAKRRLPWVRPAQAGGSCGASTAKIDGGRRRRFGVLAGAAEFSCAGSKSASAIAARHASRSSVADASWVGSASGRRWLARFGRVPIPASAIGAGVSASGLLLLRIAERVRRTPSVRQGLCRGTKWVASGSGATGSTSCRFDLRGCVGSSLCRLICNFGFRLGFRNVGESIQDRLIAHRCVAGSGVV